MCTIKKHAVKIYFVRIENKYEQMYGRHFIPSFKGSQLLCPRYINAFTRSCVVRIDIDHLEDKKNV